VGCFCQDCAITPKDFIEPLVYCLRRNSLPHTSGLPAHEPQLSLALVTPSSTPHSSSQHHHHRITLNAQQESSCATCSARVETDLRSCIALTMVFSYGYCYGYG
jgi:hypothetical protein